MISQTSICKCLILLPLFATLLLTDEAPYVHVDLIGPLLRLVRREAKVKTTPLRSKSIQTCYLLVSLYYYWRFRPPMNHVSFLEANILVSKNKIKQSVVKLFEPNCVFKIINFYLSYPLFLFLFVFIIHFCISLFYFFHPRETWHAFLLSMRFTGKETCVRKLFSLF